jgi:hypothetical protein
MTDIKQKLEILYDLLVDNYSTLEAELKELIANPSRIENTNKFASLLSDLKNSTFIEPLLLKISLSEKNDPWLADFLYAVISLLDGSSVNDEFDIPNNLIDKLGIWVLDSKDEISWKSANLLKFYESETAETIQLKKLEERGDFFLTYAECVLGLLRFNKNKHLELVVQISKDETRDQELRDFADNLIKNYR